MVPIGPPCSTGGGEPILVTERLVRPPIYACVDIKEFIDRKLDILPSHRMLPRLFHARTALVEFPYARIRDAPITTLEDGSGLLEIEVRRALRKDLPRYLLMPRLLYVHREDRLILHSYDRHVVHPLPLRARPAQ